MEHPRSVVSHPHRKRSLYALAASVGAGMTALLVWFEEIMLFAADFVGVCFLPILAAVIYFYNILVFQSAMPHSTDINHK